VDYIFLAVMGFNMRPEDAARELDQKLRRYPWYLSVGVGDTERGVALFVYVKSARHHELEFLSHGWMGYPILVRPVGSIKPVARQGVASAQN
jgi:hypothetical protein